MDFIPVKCPSCGGDLMLPKTKDDAICTYCGSKFLLKEATSKTPSPSIENWLLLAQTALGSGNSKEAYDFYNRVLEVDSNNADAWLGKGISAGWQSGVGNPRIIEMLNCFSKAMEYSEIDKQDEIKARMASSASDILAAFSQLAINFLYEHVKVDSSWNEYVSNGKAILIGVDYVLDLAPRNPIASFAGAHTTSRLINGIEYRDYSNNIKTKGIPEQEKQPLIIKREKYAEIVKAADPTIYIPKIQKKKSGWGGLFG